METDLVIHSREGDLFHYRWAARRCLRLILPNSRLKCIVIEGSKNKELAGEYVIDVAEYMDSVGDGKEDVTYYQLKHSTKRVSQPFNLSDLKDTIEGFASRYSVGSSGGRKTSHYGDVKFSIVTNRPFSDKFKENISKIRNGDEVEKRFLGKIENYTKLKGKRLKDFCTSLEIVDGEGNYNEQRHKLHAEMSNIVAGAVSNEEIDHIIALVSDTDNFKHKIVREDILKRFGVTSESCLFPAPPKFDELKCLIKREQHESLLKNILDCSAPIIIHAGGGVGKTVVARQLSKSLPSGSLGIVYDCFGAGKYRNGSQPRHRHSDALLQIANEIAYEGLCAPLIPKANDSDSTILKAFLERLNTAAKNLKEIHNKAVLAILIDAADNAEMAAKEFSEPCFVNQLLREDVPDGCKIIAFCRTERRSDLKPTSKVTQLPLEPFSKAETLAHLRGTFNNASVDDGLEFHRLTGGNPRVQANALCINHKTVSDVLSNLGPAGTTVNEQIEAQLKSAIIKVKEELPDNYQDHINMICMGLANLPPFISLKVLATVSGVDESTVKSFVADLGRPLWMSENSVHFRDEPTETWFRETFSASPSQIGEFVARLKPLASAFPYVAEALPSLMLQSENYDELISLALSDELLPEDNPIDERNVRVHRLQFAFKAALKQKKYADAAKLAFRAGEEVSGDNRQLTLLAENVDLIAPLQSELRVQELAFRRMLCGDWEGSENVYAASLLSTVEDFKGEARSYLRSANNWLELHFEERKKNRDKHARELLKDEDIVELSFSHFNLFGEKKLVDFILSWKPAEVIFRVSRLFIRRLIDAGNFTAINKIANIGCNNQYLVIAITDELLKVGMYPPNGAICKCFDLLMNNRKRIPKPSISFGENAIATAIASFIEVCLTVKLPAEKITSILRHYLPLKATHFISSDHRDDERTLYLRSIALQYVLLGNLAPDIDELIPPEWIEKKKAYQYEQDVKSFKQFVGGLLPWFIIRAQLLIGNIDDFDAVFQDATKRSTSAYASRYRDYDLLPYEIARIKFEILALNRALISTEVQSYTREFFSEKIKFKFPDRLNAVRLAYRLEHLFTIREQFEQSCSEIMMKPSMDEGPESRAGEFIALARAVLPVSIQDSAAYFDYAIEAVSKFGDEIVERWDAIVSVAKRYAEKGSDSPKVAYRFIRCTELVGDTVAREKYFNRNDAVSVCTKLSPVSGLAALSRWRDRDVGWRDRQLPALANELVQADVIPPSVGWSLSAFSWEYGLIDFAGLCIEKEPEVARRQYILDSIVRTNLQNNIDEQADWEKIGSIAHRFSLENKELKQVLNDYSGYSSESNEAGIKQTSSANTTKEYEHIDRDALFLSLDLTTSLGLSTAIDRFDEIPPPISKEVFWKEVYKRVPESEVSNFLETLTNAESAGIYDIEYALTYFPPNWRKKASVVRVWPKIVLLTARRFASVFTSAYWVNKFIDLSVCNKDSTLSLIHKGVMEGLTETCNIVDASTFFSFIDIASSFITPEEAGGLVDYALSRFEEHIDSDYADGPWDDWLAPPEKTVDAFTGFIWAALGSPRSAIRWKAAHAVRRLAEAGCKNEIDALLSWMDKEIIGAFGSHKFPFYHLHARQYLLIALARVAIDNPQILKTHSLTFVQKALENIPHVLIQKFAAEIAFSIETAFPGTYDSNITEKLKQINKSHLPIKEIDKYGEKLESPWHARGEIDQTFELHFCYDFDRYWFNALGDVFGLPADQIGDLAREVVLKDWNLKIDDDFIRDPRNNLWRSSYSRETSHSHGSYPKTDDYSFYLSYHAQMTVAAKLIQEMPIVRSRDWQENEWSAWLQRHSLIRDDGRWLADRRDPLPIERRTWVRKISTDNWRWEIAAEDFLDGLLIERNDETWLNVYGSWNDNESEREERYSISSAFVATESSQSLLNALTSCREPSNYKLPNYEEEDMEFDVPPFELSGWISSRSENSGRIDGFDPHAGDISYPPYEIGEKIVDQFGLSVDLERRKWRLPGSTNASLESEIWSMSHDKERDAPYRHGNRMASSLNFLQKLCSDLKKELIFKVELERNLRRSYGSRSDNGYEYLPANCKVYILSADGKLRDERKSYKLR